MIVRFLISMAARVIERPPLTLNRQRIFTVFQPLLEPEVTTNSELLVPCVL